MTRNANLSAHQSMGRNQTPRTVFRLSATVLALSLLAAIAPNRAAASTPEPRPQSGGAPPTKVVSPAEQRASEAFSIEHIQRVATPTRLPSIPAAQLQRQGPDGPQATVRGALPLNPTTTRIGTESVAAQNGLWSGGYAANPNRQVGKLYYDTKRGPGEVWSWCSATAINSENRSTIVTAGHCVFNTDPDQNLRIDGNGYWYENVRFCPGYEYGCRLGIWYSRQVSTTNSWFYGTGAARSYDWADDVAMVVVSRNPAKGYLVDAVGGQGITFNARAGLDRHAFGYPGPDSRFPAYRYNAEDLIYCRGTDGPDGYGHLKIACTMTGGASGGPWITSPASNWMGLVNSVNSHKPWGGPYMGGPYFGSAEASLFQYARAR